MARILDLFEKLRRKPRQEELRAVSGEVKGDGGNDRRHAFLRAAPELASLRDEYSASIRFEMAPKAIAGALNATRPQPPITLEDFIKIPPEQITADILTHGASLTREHSSLVGAKFSRDYGRLVKRMAQKDIAAIKHVHGAFISDLMAAEYLVGQPDEFDPVSQKTVGYSSIRISRLGLS